MSLKEVNKTALNLSSSSSSEKHQPLSLNHVAITPKINRNRGLSLNSLNSSAGSSVKNRTGINLGLHLVSSNSGDRTRRRLFKDETKDMHINDNNNNDNLTNKRKNVVVNDEDETVKEESDGEDVINAGNPKGNKLSDKFRHLAQKEQEILEIKNSIKELVQKKRHKDHELNDLKREIEIELIRKARTKPMDNANTHQSFDSSASKKPLNDPNYSIQKIPNSQDERKSSSWFSKPLSYIQQFDSMVSQEFEKLNISLHDQNYDNDDSEGQFYDHQKDDMMHSVSQHLWTFVNDVKSNLLITHDDDLKTHNDNHDVSNSTIIPDLIDLNTPTKGANNRSNANTNTISASDFTNHNKRIACESKELNSIIDDEEIELWDTESIDI